MRDSGALAQGWMEPVSKWNHVPSGSAGLSKPAGAGYTKGHFEESSGLGDVITGLGRGGAVPTETLTALRAKEVEMVTPSWASQRSWSWLAQQRSSSQGGAEGEPGGGSSEPGLRHTRPASCARLRWGPQDHVCP